MKIIKILLNHLLSWHEYVTIPVAFVLWYFSPKLLQLIDPTSATYDAGVFQVIIFTIIQFLIYNAVAWIVFKLTFPKMYKMLDDEIENKVLNNGAITMWEKIKIVLWVFSLYLISIVLLSRVIG
jgi:Na+/phosphate symporter